MLLPIEIKANVDGRVPDARCGAAVAHSDAARRIFIAEDIDGVGKGETPLLRGGAIVRNRIGDDRDDATAKLQPCDETQLGGDWTAPFDEPPLRCRIEGDRSRRRRVLAASAVVEHIAGELLGLVGVGGDAPEELAGPQRRFRRQGAAPRVALDPYTTLLDAADCRRCPGKRVSRNDDRSLQDQVRPRRRAVSRRAAVHPLRPCIKPGMLQLFALRGG